VGSAAPERLYDLPGGAKRMVVRSRGIAATIVNGSAIWSDGELCDGLPGAVLSS
jgi:hypothetical protein